MKEQKATNGRTWIHKLLGVIISAALIVVLLISSFEIGAYSDLDFYEKEYEKYGVREQLQMEMCDLRNVTEYMMSYLRGDKEVLSIMTPVEGERQDFFNEQDRLHMEDVQKLFLGGLALRRGAVFVILWELYFCQAMKGDWKNLIPQMYQWTLAVFLTVTVILGILFSQNFTKYFVIFHKIFFDNDLWIFDPAEDYMIRMLPEGFFFDMVMRIGGIFIVFLLGFLIMSVIWKKINKKN